jgi:asparagine synthase (glutamine-hydrolysing)
MPGLVGYLGAQPEENIRDRLQTMISALEPGGGFQVNTIAQDGLGLGQVSLGVFNSQAQPIWNSAGMRCIFFEGELYNTKSLWDSVQPGSVHNGSHNDGALVLLLFEKHGYEFAQMLNGSFVAAIWDAQEHELLLVSDRMGTYPLYYAAFRGSFAFASGVRALLAHPELHREPDRVAIAQFLTFDHVLNVRTLLESVKLLPQASILHYKDGEMRCEPYFVFKYPDPYPLRSEADYTAEFLSLLEQAVARQSQHDQPLGVLLSGGLDSRFILPYLIKHTNQNPLHAFTWGSEDCDDYRFAREIAHRTGVNHHFFELKSDWLLSLAQDAVRITDGMGNVVNMHALATLQEETRYSNVIFKGFLGDAMMGFALRPPFWANYDDETLPHVHLQVHTSQGVISYNQAERDLLFTDSFKKSIVNAILDEYTSGMKASGSALLADQRNYFDYLQRVPRMTIKGVEVVRQKAMVRLPFCDNDLIDFALRLPPGYRYERSLMRNAFIQAFPLLAQVPATPSGLPLVNCARDIRIRAERLVRWHMHNRGMLKGPYTERRPYAHYHEWFRTLLREWVEGTLLSKRSLERGYLNPDAVKRVVAEHMQGANHAVRLGALLTLELWHQQYID